MVRASFSSFAICLMLPLSIGLAQTLCNHTSCFPLPALCGTNGRRRYYPPNLYPASLAAGGGAAMTFEELLDQAIALLQRRRRLTYRALKRQFDLDDDYLADLKAELIQGQRLAVDEDGEVLVWTGGTEGCPHRTPPTPHKGPPPGPVDVKF